jgi:hypothetical protein
MKYFLFLIAALFLAACSHGLEPAPANDEIVLINKTGETIYYAAFEQGVLAVINWAPISRDENRINSGNAKPVQFSEIYAFEPGKNFVLYWWTNNQNKVAHFSVMVVTPQKLKSTGRRFALTGFTS